MTRLLATALLTSSVVAVVALGISQPDDSAAWDQAREGAADCTVSLWGPTESDAADVAACVDAAIVRASNRFDTPSKQ